MKKKPFIMGMLMLFGAGSLYSQSDETPNVLTNYLEGQNYTVEGTFRMQLPVPLGMGAAGSYFIPKVIHARAEAGFGWTYVTKPGESNNRLFAGWFDVFVGYPISFSEVSNTKFVISSSQRRTSSGTVHTENYFDIKAPHQIYIIPEAGIVSYPNGQYSAPSAALGITFRRLVNVEKRECGLPGQGPQIHIFLRRLDFSLEG